MGRNTGNRAGGGIVRGVGKKHPARRIERAVGYSALAGLALLLLCIPLGLVMNLFEDGHESPVFLVPLFLGFVLAGAGWIVWGSWSATLDRYSEPLSTTAKLTLAGSVTLVLGVLSFMAAGSPLVLYTDTDPPDSLIPVVLGLAGLGVLLVAGTIVGAAVYGGIALGGPRWWWVGALLSAGLVATSTGWAFGWPLITVLGAAGLVVSVYGYFGALRSGVTQGRPDAVESEQFLEREDP